MSLGNLNDHLRMCEHLLNVKNDSLVAMLSKLRKSCLARFEDFPLLMYKLSIQISMVSSSGIFANKELTSRLIMCKLGSCGQISSAKSEMNQ